MIKVYITGFSSLEVCNILAPKPIQARTVSLVKSGKYIFLPFGIFKLKPAPVVVIKFTIEQDVMPEKCHA